MTQLMMMMLMNWLVANRRLVQELARAQTQIEAVDSMSRQAKLCFDLVVSKEFGSIGA